MNNFNMFNFMKMQQIFQLNNNMMICPFKPIICNSNINNINNLSYANSVLQGLSNLKCINIWINQLNFNFHQLINNNNKIITYELFLIFSSLYKGQMADSSNLILNFNNKMQVKNYNKNEPDPYHFLFYLLMILHEENNYPMNPNYDKNKLINQNENDKNVMRNVFTEFLQQTENSIISNNFYIRFGHCFDCPNCSKTYKDSYKYMIKFEMEKYKKFRDEYNNNRSMYNLNMEECFICYTGGKKLQCIVDGSFNKKEYISLYSTSNVLIIVLYRQNHVFKCDLDFPLQISLNNFYEIGRFMNGYYFLKSCVSLNNQNFYFSFVNINNYWWRFCGNNSSYVCNINQEIYQYEPQILIYELQNW